MQSFYSPLLRNIILDTDSYKNDHQRMLPPTTKEIYSTVVPRKANQYTDKIKVFGQQYLLKHYLTEQLTQTMINEAQIEIEEQGYHFNRERWEYILTKYNGYLPLEIKAIPEGAYIPVGLPIMTIRNTDHNCAWLVSYIETMLHRIMWKMTTVASIATELYYYLDNTLFKHTGQRGNAIYSLHNFGSRGADSYESDVMSGMAHLASGFRGTDCLQANRNIKHYYNTNEAFGSSVLATEHCNICAFSDTALRDDFNAADKMLDVLDEAITQFKQTGKGLPIMSILGDTYDIYRFTGEYLGVKLKERVLQVGKKGGRLVLRPDSGVPEEVSVKCVEILMDKFGYTTNQYGYKVLPDFLRVLQGDGINTSSIREIIRCLEEKKISLENMVFGMGGGLTHEASRDEFSFSMKSTAILDGNNWRDLFKDPVTDKGKMSLKGRITAYKDTETGKIFADRLESQDSNPSWVNIMETIYLNGMITKQYTFEEIVHRVI